MNTEKDRIFIEMPPLTKQERKVFIKAITDSFKKKKIQKKVPTGVEISMKFCSQLGELFKHPYFFNWSAPTNHRDDSKTGSFEDVYYVIFRVGKYTTQSIEERSFPQEKQIYFGPVFRLKEKTPLQFLIELFNINACDDNKAISLIKEKIDQIIEKE